MIPKMKTKTTGRKRLEYAAFLTIVFFGCFCSDTAEGEQMTVSDSNIDSKMDNWLENILNHQSANDFLTELSDDTHNTREDQVIDSWEIREKTVNNGDQSRSETETIMNAGERRTKFDRNLKLPHIISNLENHSKPNPALGFSQFRVNQNPDTQSIIHTSRLKRASEEATHKSHEGEKHNTEDAHDSQEDAHNDEEALIPQWALPFLLLGVGLVFLTLMCLVKQCVEDTQDGPPKSVFQKIKYFICSKKIKKETPQVNTDVETGLPDQLSNLFSGSQVTLVKKDSKDNIPINNFYYDNFIKY